MPKVPPPAASGKVGPEVGRNLAAWLAERALPEPEAIPEPQGAPEPQGFELDERALDRASTATLAEALGAIRSYLQRYVAFPSPHESIAVALWVGHAHLVERFEASPILAVTSAEMRSGKTRLLDCLELLVPEPRRMVLPSEAVTYTLLGQRPRPTLLLDEADAIFGARPSERTEGLRAILNAGNRRGNPVPRVKIDGKRREVDWFDVYGPKAVAGIGALPDTIADRSIPIRLKRRAPGEIVARFRRRIAEAEAAACRFDWASAEVPETADVPDRLPDRAADSWEPLLAIADATGGDWPQVARLAAVALSGQDEEHVTTGIRLLGDVRDAFDGADHLPTGELLRRLHEMEDAPWAEWYGKPLTARCLARLLEPYRVTPARRRVGGSNLRGYFAADLLDAWSRYVVAPLRKAVHPEQVARRAWMAPGPFRFVPLPWRRPFRLDRLFRLLRRGRRTPS